MKLPSFLRMPEGYAEELSECTAFVLWYVIVPTGILCALVSAVVYLALRLLS